ncbi:MAG: GMC family oxidoreductase [Candidatus Binataceae bacterium]
MNDSLPRFADTIVIGGGTGGAAIAGELATHSAETVLLLEAGPDYGPFEGGRWPADLTDARALPTSHDWGYTSGSQYGKRVVNFDRARVIGGCSSHNGCAAIWGSRLDYDRWAGLGNSGWSTDELLPFFRAGSERLRVRIPPHDEITPYQLAWLEAAPRGGIPVVADLNDLDENVGMGPSPANIANGIRWNSAFAYLDPARGRSNLTIVDGALTDHLIIRTGRVDAVRVIRNGREETIEAGRVVLAAGAYGSPAILLRSGVGDGAELRGLGIAPAVDLQGVGRNLHDHPTTGLLFAGTTALETSMAEFARRRWMPEEQTIAKARTSRCGSGFDLHMFPVGGPATGDPNAWSWSLAIACMTPRSRGVLKLASSDPTAAPILDHRFLSDADGDDLRILVEGMQIGREVAAATSLAALLGDEKWPGREVASADQAAAFVRANVAHYYHPVGTCAMGPARDAGAVVDSRGRVHGLDNCYVGDASIMPMVPRANTNIPALVVGLRIAGWLLEA